MKTGKPFLKQSSFSYPKENNYIAHLREWDGMPQTVEEHLVEEGNWLY